MKILKIILLVVFLPSVALAEKVAYVDIEAVVKQSKAAQDSSKEFEKLIQKFQEDYKSKQQIISDKQQELINKSNVLSEDVLEKEKQQLLLQFKSFEEELAKEKSLLEAKYRSVTNQINNEIKKIITDIATERKYDVVLNKTSVIFVNKSLNISDDVANQLNKSLPSVKLGE